MFSSGCEKQQLSASQNQGSAMSDDEMHQKFKEMRIQRSSDPLRQTYFEMIKSYFKNEQELRDWVLNVWNYSKYMLFDDLCHQYAIANIELIKDHWNEEEWVNSEFLIEHLIANDPAFYDFQVFFNPKNLTMNKTIIYDIIKKQDTCDC